MKKLFLIFIVAIIYFSIAGCSSKKDRFDGESIDKFQKDIEDIDEQKPIETVTPAADDDTIIVWCITSELYDIVNKFIETHPDFDYKIKINSFATMDVDYEKLLYETLRKGHLSLYDFEVPDIYSVEMSYVARFTQGDAYQYSADYKELGIDVDRLPRDAEIPEYYVEIGTNPDGKLMGLGYHNTSGAFIYRRSIAKEVWGTDEPSIINDIIGPGWDKFFEAAEDLKEKGFGICSGIEDIWHMVKNSADLGWVLDGKLYIDPKREAFLDYAYKLVENDYTNNTKAWSDAWYQDMKGEGEKDILGFFGPSWLVNYVIMPYCGGETIGEGTYGDWAISNAPLDFFWGGSMVMARKDTKHKEAVGEILEWITLDTSETGLQELWASEEFYPGVKEIPAATKVAKRHENRMDFLGGQDIFEAYISAGYHTSGNNSTMYDVSIDGYWPEQVHEYVNGGKTREEAIADFKELVDERTDVVVE